jgi:hypothetical protein
MAFAKGEHMVWETCYYDDPAAPIEGAAVVMEDGDFREE